MELPAIDPSEAYIPHPMEDPGDKRPPEEARLATIAGGYEMDDSVILSSSFPQVPGYEEAVIGKQAAGPSAGGGASESAPAAALPTLPAKRKRGRPPKNPGGTAKQPASTAKRREEEESVCFVCLDGGTLVVCDRRGCLKAYHPACIGRDEAFFRSRSRWNCGWHMCSVCGKAASFMCYTCPYSLCKGCIRGTDFFCIRGNKGLCVSCYRLVSLLEKDGQANGEKVEVNFNDENSWEYLFKIYWLVLKGKLSLTIKELDDARRLWKVPGISAHKEASSDELYNADEQDASSDSSTGRHKAKVSSRRRNRKNAGKSADIKSPIHSEDNKQEGEFFPEEVWASQELLDFVAHMRHGNKSLLTQFDVQNLLLEYIKQNNLRNPRRRSQILCDARLEKLFGKDRVGHFEMLKLLELHFVVKETSEVEAEDKQEGPLDNHMDLMDVEELKSRELHNDTDKRHKNRKRVEEKGLLNVNDFAAIDAHNINLIYLRRSLMEQMIDDNNAFADNVVGFFVRIRIPGAGQKQDVYRLVQIVGTQKVAEKYKVGKKTTDLKLEILNLDRTETVAIDTISNQDFTEEECRRLRQSIKCGFINRLTVGNVQNKARILQAVRVTDWLENEKLRLSHLRDRASETGRRKEECVEKLELLSKPEERMRRLNEVPEIHADPHMDPNYESPEEETHEKQGGRLRDMSGMKRKELFSPSRVSGDILSGALKTSSPSWTSNKTSSTEESQGKFEALIDAGEKITEALWNSNHDKNFSRASSRETPKVHAVLTNTIPNLQSGKQLALKPGEPHGVARPLSSVISVLSRAHDNDMIWHYQDPAGKIQGPFSMLQLRKWDSTGYFPPDLKIWLTSQKQEDAIQLTDALSVIQKATQQEQSSNFPRATNFVGSEVSTENKIYSGCKVDSSITSVKNPSDFTMLASSQNVGNNPAQMNQSTDLGTQKEVLDSCSRDTQYKLAKGNMGREVVSSLNATSLRDSVTNKNQFFESSCPSPTPGSEMKGLSPVHTNEVGPCQMMTKVSEAYAVQSQERDPAPPSVDRDGNLLNCSSSRQHADSDEIQFVLAQKAEYASVPKILSPSQEQLAVSVEENLLDDYEILDGISVINLEQHRNDDPEPSFLEPGHLESAELEGAEDIKTIEWSLPSPTPAPQPSSEWVLSPSLAQRGNPSNTLPPPIEADTSRQGRNVSLEWETPVTGTISVSIDSGEGKQLNGSMKAGCGWGSSSQGDRSGSSPGWGEQSLGSMSANGGWGSPNSGRKTNGDSGWGAQSQSQSSMNTSGGRASTIESKSDANSAWGSDVQGNNNWGLPTWEKEQTNCGWRSPGGRHANENSGWATPTRSANTNTNEGSVTARGSNVNCNDARSYGNDGHREGNQSKHGSDWNLRYKACSGGSGGNGSSSRGTLKGVQGQRGVCKFYESGYCKKGSSCKYLHS